jgi:nucleotide sugar dehydrogenase
MKVAIIGMGTVGTGQARFFKEHDLVTYDPRFNDTYPEQDIAGCDFAVICTGTPEGPDGAADTTDFHAATARLPATMPMLIRSTVPPGTTDSLQAIRSGLTCFCPEFMHERPGGIWKDSSDVPWLILGGIQQATQWFHDVLREIYPGVIYQCRAMPAELAKYTANIYWAMRVTFANEMARVCQSYGISWEETRSAWLQDSRINPAYTAMAGFPPGFGGRCLPKDLAALIKASSSNGYEPEFLRCIQNANMLFTET